MDRLGVDCVSLLLLLLLPSLEDFVMDVLVQDGWLFGRLVRLWSDIGNAIFMPFCFLA